MAHINTVKTPEYFISEDFILVDNLREFISLKMDNRWILIVLCEEGQLCMEYKEELHLLHKNDLLLCTPGDKLDSLILNEEFNGIIIGFSEQIAKKCVPDSTKMWSLMFSMMQVKQLHLTNSMVSELKIDYNYVKHKISMTLSEYSEYYTDIVRCAFQTMLYCALEPIKSLMQSIPMKGYLFSKEQISKAFFDLLANTRPKRRNVTWYSDRLYKTPKYLSTVIREVSGKPPLKWINDAVTAEIIDLLKNSSKSISEISDELKFPTLSAFGRYCRNNIGMSPKEFRSNKKSDL